MIRNQDEFNDKRKQLRPGKVSPRLSVPDHIWKPPYVTSQQSPGISSGPEIHDERGVECMRASGKLAARVLEYAGTLVKVNLIIRSFVNLLYLTNLLYHLCYILVK